MANGKTEFWVYQSEWVLVMARRAEEEGEEFTAEDTIAVFKFQHVSNVIRPDERFEIREGPEGTGKRLYRPKMLFPREIEFVEARRAQEATEENK